MRRHGILFFLLLFFLLHLGNAPAGGCQSPWLASGDRFLGSQAPGFALPNLAGEKQELVSWVNQKATLLIFWATWCPTCVEEIPTLNQWAAQYPSLQILAINVQEPAKRVKAFAKKKKIDYPILLDEEGEVAEKYGLVGIPAAVLLSKGGKILYYGYSLPQNIESLIQ